MRLRSPIFKTIKKRNIVRFCCLFVPKRQHEKSDRMNKNYQAFFQSKQYCGNLREFRNFSFSVMRKLSQSKIMEFDLFSRTVRWIFLLKFRWKPVRQKSETLNKGFNKWTFLKGPQDEIKWRNVSNQTENVRIGFHDLHEVNFFI